MHNSSLLGITKTVLLSISVIFTVSCNQNKCKTGGMNVLIGTDGRERQFPTAAQLGAYAEGSQKQRQELMHEWITILSRQDRAYSRLIAAKSILEAISSQGGWQHVTDSDARVIAEQLIQPGVTAPVIIARVSASKLLDAFAPCLALEVDGELQRLSDHLPSEWQVADVQVKLDGEVAYDRPGVQPLIEANDAFFVNGSDRTSFKISLFPSAFIRTDRLPGDHRMEINFTVIPAQRRPVRLRRSYVIHIVDPSSDRHR